MGCKVCSTEENTCEGCENCSAHCECNKGDEPAATESTEAAAPAEPAAE